MLEILCAFLTCECNEQVIEVNRFGTHFPSVGRSVGQSVGQSVSWSVDQFPVNLLT